MTTDSRDKLSQDERVTARLSGGPPAGDLEAAPAPELGRNAPTVIAQRRVPAELPSKPNDELFDEELGALLGPSLLARFGRLALWATGGALLAVAVWYGLRPLFEGESPSVEVSAAQPAREPAPARAVPRHDPPAVASVRTEKPVTPEIATVPAKTHEAEARREAGKGVRPARRARPSSEALPASGLVSPREPRDGERVASPTTEPAPSPGGRDFTRPIAPLAD